MAAQHRSCNWRAHRYLNNPDTVVTAPPGAKVVALALDLGSTRLTLDLSHPRALKLLRDLETAIRQLGSDHHSRERTLVRQPWAR